jgi:hypothetical protein
MTQQMAATPVTASRPRATQTCPAPDSLLSILIY